MSATLEEQIACVEREIGKREYHYPRWVASGTLEQPEADKELRRMRAVLETLEGLRPEKTQQMGLLQGQNYGGTL